MSELLDKAIARVKQLSESQQNEIAAMIIEELESDKQWDDAFAKSPDLLAKLAAEALAEDAEGKTKELDLDTL